VQNILVTKSNSWMITQIINNKHECEKEMAEAILQAFDNSKDKDVLGVLRGIVANSIDDIKDIIAAKGEAAFTAAYGKDASNYGFVSGKGLANSEKFLSFVGNTSNVFESMNTDECGCMIRFYGEVIEAGNKIGGADESKAIKAKLKALEDHKASYQLSSEANKPEWKKSSQETGKEVPKSDAALRNRVSASPKPLKWEKAPTEHPSQADQAAIEKFEARQKEVQAYRLKRSKVERQLAAAGGGIGVWVQEDEDLLARMNKVFGLIHGATISGTTTDTIFFLNRMTLVDKYMGVRLPDELGQPTPDWLESYYGGWDWSTYKKTHIKKVVAPQGLDPLYYLIPIGTIVGKGHHSVLEVAIPLTQNKKMNYIIGKYTRLLLDREGRENSDAADIVSVLKRYENDDRNKRVLIYYTAQKEIEGYVLFDKAEAIWDDIALANQNLMNKFKSFATHPTKAQVASLHPELNRLLLQSPAPQKVTTGAEQVFASRRAMFERPVPRPQRQ